MKVRVWLQRHHEWCRHSLDVFTDTDYRFCRHGLAVDCPFEIEQFERGQFQLPLPHKYLISEVLALLGEEYVLALENTTKEGLVDYFSIHYKSALL